MEMVFKFKNFLNVWNRFVLIENFKNCHFDHSYGSKYCFWVEIYKDQNWEHLKLPKKGIFDDLKLLTIVSWKIWLEIPSYGVPKICNIDFELE